MKIYQDSGYLDVDSIMSTNDWCVCVYGGRGSGKTYGFLEWLTKNNICFMLLRRTQTQFETVSNANFSPFAVVDQDHGWEHTIVKVGKHMAAVYDGKPEPCGYMAALSTIANIRGFDAHRIQVLLYDEFIPERHERKLAHEGEALLNAYETINRNRELSGEKPLKLVCLGNSNDLSNPVFITLGLIERAERMKNAGREMSRNDGILMIDTYRSPVAERKSGTAMYSNIKDSAFRRMALSSAFERISDSRISSRPLQEFRPVSCIGEIAIYRHKSTPEWYVCRHKSGHMSEYGTTEVEIRRFVRSHGKLLAAYYANNVTFADLTSETILTAYLNI